MEPPSFDKRTDRVARLVKDLTADEFVDWLIEYKGLKRECRENVVSNLDEQLRWHRLQGRLDRSPFWSFMAELLRVRRTAL